jgi:hypothetical protein
MRYSLVQKIVTQLQGLKFIGMVQDKQILPTGSQLEQKLDT